VARDLCGELVSGDSSDGPSTKYVRTKEAKAAQALRISQLERQGYTVRVGQSAGLTVFRWGCGGER
jgi:hypothetical protein